MGLSRRCHGTGREWHDFKDDLAASMTLDNSKRKNQKLQSLYSGLKS